MINFEDLFSQLPDPPKFRGKWVPVYLEPMMASGERLTVAVAAIGVDGSSLVKVALRNEKIQAMYGDKGSAFNSIIETLVASLQYHLHTKQTFEGWSIPFSGISLGTERDAMSKDIIGILRQAVAMTASLSALDFDGMSDDVRPAEKNDRWPTQVRDEVLRNHPELAQYFRRDFITSSQSKACRLFYLSSNIAINTGKLVPGNTLSHNFDVNKSRILDLLTVKENEGFAPRNFHELIVYRPGHDEAMFSESQMKSLDGYVNALIDAGDRHEIRVTTVSSAEDASTRLCKLEFY